jgi:hypothetical protein
MVEIDVIIIIISLLFRIKQLILEIDVIHSFTNIVKSVPMYV